MGSKRPIGMEDRFVAYDPKKKTCNPADRNLIKRLAGKQGSETKKRRLRQEKAARMKIASASGTSQTGPQACEVFGSESRRASQQPNTFPQPPGALESLPVNRDLLFPQHRLDSLWGPDTNGWPSPASHASSTMSRADGMSSYTPLASPSYPAVVTPTASSQASNDYYEYFPPTNDISYDMSGGILRPAGFAQPPSGSCRTFGSFDSGFQDQDSFDFSFDTIPDTSDCSSQLHRHPLDDQVIDNTSPWPHFQQAELQTISSQSLTKTFPPPENNLEQDHRVGGPAKHAAYPSPRSLVETGTRSSKSPKESEPRTLNTNSQRQESETTRTHQTRWPSIDSALAEWVCDMEKQGQLSAGSSSACLDALSECEEARLLWQLNLSRLNPKLVLCPDRPNDVYARAQAKLRRMSSGQRLSVEGIMIRLGIAEYVAISLVLEVSSLVRDIDTRRDLKVSSSAVAIADHRLAGISPGTRSITRHLWPDNGEER